MYNLIVGDTGQSSGPHAGAFTRDRVLSHTDPLIVEYMAMRPQPAGLSVAGRPLPEPSRLTSLPTLLMPEIGFEHCRQVARVGRLEHAQFMAGTGEYRFRFLPNPTILEVPTGTIESIALELGVTNRFELMRTHWAVKDVDLYGMLGPIAGGRPEPKVFQLPPEAPREELVGIMMPFDERFTPVYRVLREAVSDAGMECVRADDIWEEDHVMQDIANLIARSKVIIADLSGKNPNVFYETGIAHTLGRDVIQITQSAEDVPFDLKALRYLTYLPNREGLADLKKKVTGRLQALLARS